MDRILFSIVLIKAAMKNKAGIKKKQTICHSFRSITTRAFFCSLEEMNTS